MSALVGASGQNKRYFLFDASGTITTGGTPQLILPQHQSRSYLLIQNNAASGSLFVEFGSARGTASITNGVVTGVTITNAGFNFTKPPTVKFWGGGNAGNTSYLGLNQPGGEAPHNLVTAGAPAHGIAVMTGSAPNLSVASVTLTNGTKNDPLGGIGYVIAPFVQFINSDLDPYGAAVPSATVGIQLLPGAVGKLEYNGTMTPTDPVSIFGATTGQAFTCKWMQ